MIIVANLQTPLHAEQSAEGRPAHSELNDQPA